MKNRNPKGFENLRVSLPLPIPPVKRPYYSGRTELHIYRVRAAVAGIALRRHVERRIAAQHARVGHAGSGKLQAYALSIAAGAALLVTAYALG